MTFPRIREPRSHDVLIGAGGPGFAPRSRARAAGADVGLVCKSLLGKAHTVMAEGGVAAALAHVAPAQSVAIISATRWSAARSSTARVWPSCTRWNRRRVFASSSNGGRSSIARPSAASSSDRSAATHPRLAHVDDRTGLEMHAQDRAVAAGIDVYMECTIPRLVTDRDGVTHAVGYWRTTGRPIVFAARPSS